MATGLGKSVVIATLPELLALEEGDVLLTVAHRDELISQLVDKFHAANPGAVIGIEKADQRASAACSIVVATVQTLSGPRLREFLERFGRRVSVFIIDEAHHAAAPTYRAIVEAVVAARPDALVFGFTATPNRGDGVRLIDVFHKIVFSMDARAAIDEGYLVPVRSYGVATTTNLDEVASRLGDFVIGQLAAAVNTVDRNRRIVDAYLRHTPGMKALVFTASVQHARDVCAEFIAAGVKASFASGETPTEERERVVSDFRNGRSDVLGQLRSVSRGLRRPVDSGRHQRAADEEHDAVHADHRPRPAPRRRDRQRALRRSKRRRAPRIDLAESRNRTRSSSTWSTRRIATRS